MDDGPGLDSLTALIVHHRTPELLEAAIASLQGPDGPELLVVHVAADDDPPLPRLEDARRIVVEGNPGYAAAVNAGLREVRTENVLVLNADVVIAREDAARLITALRDIPGVGAVGPRLFDTTGEREAVSAARDDPRLGDRVRFHLGLAEADPVTRRAALTDAPSLVGALSGAAFAMRTDTLRRLGGLDASFRFYGEDLDLFRRIREAGLRVVHGVGVARHVGGASGRGREATLLARLLDADRRWFARHLNPRSAHAIRLAAFTGALLAPGAALWDLVRLKGRGRARRRLIRGVVRLRFGLFGAVPDAALARLDRRLVRLETAPS